MNGRVGAVEARPRVGSRRFYNFLVIFFILLEPLSNTVGRLNNQGRLFLASLMQWVQFCVGNSGQRVPSRYKWRVKSQDLTTGRFLGQGCSGIFHETVWTGSHDSKVRLARKLFPGVKGDDFESEVVRLFEFNHHPNVLKTFCWTVDNRSCSLVMEHVGDNLCSVMRKRREALRKQTGTTPFQLPEAIDLVLQIAKGMQYLHDGGIIHGDLKPNNVLIDWKEGRMLVKLADFGLLKTKRRTTLVSQRAVCSQMIKWSAPEFWEDYFTSMSEDVDFLWTTGELLEDTSTSSASNIKNRPEILMEKVDSYSFALTCVYILGGQMWNGKLSPNELRKQISSSDLRPELPSGCPEKLESLISKCWDADPKLRPTFSVICNKLLEIAEDQEAQLQGIVKEQDAHVDISGIKLQEKVKEQDAELDIFDWFQEYVKEQDAELDISDRFQKNVKEQDAELDISDRFQENVKEHDAELDISDRFQEIVKEQDAEPDVSDRFQENVKEQDAELDISDTWFQENVKEQDTELDISDIMLQENVKEQDAQRELDITSSNTSFQLNERQCQVLEEELAGARIFLEYGRGVCSKSGRGFGHVNLLHLDAAIKRAELLLEKCCCKDLESWLEAAMMLVEIKEEFVAIILDIHLWRMLLDFAISSATGLSRKVEKMMSMDEEYHGLVKELHRENHKLQQAALEDKREILSRIATIHILGSTNELEYLRVIYLQSWLTLSEVGTGHLNEYKIIQILGQGGCSAVLKVDWLGVCCALKILKYREPKEATIMKGLFHPNIIRLFHYWEAPSDNPQSYILMELMPQDLAQYMQSRLKKNMPFSLPVAIDVMHQIAQAMKYMHDRHLTHRDLKPSNILVKERSNVGFPSVDGEGYLDIKLADFSLLKPYGNTSTISTCTKNVGTKAYGAPEIFEKDWTSKRKFPPMVDVWSFGVTCAAILSGENMPYGETPMSTLHKKIFNGLRPILPDYCPQYLAFCIRSCWELQPERRPNFADICKFLRHAKLLSLGATDLEDSILFFTYTTKSGRVKDLSINSSKPSLSERFSRLFQ